MQLRIAYFGLPLGALLLRADGHDLRFCVVPPISAPGLRRLKACFPERVVEAQALGSHLDEAVEARFAAEPVDLLVSWFWTRKLPKRWLERARLGGIGAHPSLLPRHRGPNPYFWAIDSGDEETGVSVHRLEPEYDTGAVFEQARLEIRDLNAWQLARALDRPSLRCLRSVVQRAASSGLGAGMPQEPGLVSLAPEPVEALLRADFSWSTARVLRRIRALSPVPGLGLTLADVVFFVTRAHPTSGFVAALEPGEAEVAQDRLILRTGDGAISVESAALATESEEVEVLSGAELAHLLGERLKATRGSSFKEERG